MTLAFSEHAASGRHANIGSAGKSLGKKELFAFAKLRIANSRCAQAVELRAVLGFANTLTRIAGVA